jgi:hypothetical protein
MSHVIKYLLLQISSMQGQGDGAGYREVQKDGELKTRWKDQTVPQKVYPDPYFKPGVNRSALF